MHFCIAAAQMPGQASQHTACDACRKNLISGFLFSAELPAWRQGAVVIHRIPAQEVAGVLLHVNFKQVPNTFCKYLSTRAHLCHVSFGACTGVDSGALGARLQGPALNSHEHPELEKNCIVGKFQEKRRQERGGQGAAWHAVLHAGAPTTGRPGLLFLLG